MEMNLGSTLAGLEPFLPVLLGLAVVTVVLTCPLPGRGPGLFHRRDPWRGFRFQARRDVFARAGDRCEAPLFLAWGRCGAAATEADHIYPWSRRGPTIVSNGQALCREHNRRKLNLRPPWWYVLALERRRKTYFPDGMDVRVLGRMTAADRAARAGSSSRSRA